MHIRRSLLPRAPHRCTGLPNAKGRQGLPWLVIARNTDTSFALPVGQWQCELNCTQADGLGSDLLQAHSDVLLNVHGETPAIPDF